MAKTRPQAGRRGQVTVTALLALAAGVGVLAWLFARAGLAPIETALAMIGVAGLLIVAAAHLPVIAVLGLAWRNSARMTPRPSAMHFVWARALRDAGSEVLPLSQFGGLAVGARALSLFDVGGRKAVIWTLLDLLVELATKLPYVLFGFGLLLLLRDGDLAGGAMLAAASAATAFLVGTNSLDPASVVPSGRGPKLFRQVGVALRRWAPRPAQRRNAMALHLIGWFAGAAETWLIFRLLGNGVALGPALVIDSLVGAIRMFGFFVPGAVGVQEGAYVLLCGIFAISPASALAFSLIRRARDLLIAAAVFLPWPWREVQRLRNADPPSNLKP